MNKKRQRKEYKMDDSWLLPYADLLTLLFALFIVLFAMSELDVQKYKELSQVFKSKFADGRGMLEESNSQMDIPADGIQELEEEEKKDKEKNKEKEKEKETRTIQIDPLTKLQKSINTYILKNNLSDVIGTELTDEGLLITILNDISFASGSAVVTKEGAKVAEEVSNLLFTDPPHQVIVSGHADDRPMHNHEFASNWELSVTRAVNFMRLILKNENLDPTRFSAKGFGEYKPIVPNTSEENRAKNRRVEVLVLPNFHTD